MGAGLFAGREAGHEAEPLQIPSLTNSGRPERTIFALRAGMSLLQARIVLSDDDIFAHRAAAGPS